ncbi:uncharacterized protein NESG_02009 [Nematocida ausubeli]|uniref:Thioredoxin domain-containing protein n=1 Tax=Nematocida ausubeli (strain ATCC PRA-371 / ERTm2) TaxID=1913371 RepID=A0A086IZC1_NEMA1|nr:uncharacterized protein NESG_02009 [Nematocida ausubeli]KAI5136165.1 hypothetical protein NEAUS06_1788 [Nematocida ausubeli]KAI5136270.1 hypothetical protein NEAUS07_1557 [Nematocida ausubeli]KAI5146981.1 hypothetical protein NEAUS05_0317 [Nematocida ausubeli]KFG25239.1 hypothetical protein NESG_02009 [Nematocida ausubeli]
MKISIFFVFLALIQNSKETFSEIQNYTVNDFSSNTPMLIFIYYNSKNSTCLACESYKKWLSSFPDYTVGAFTIKKLNFNTDPVLSLRFKATSFPTFFLQHKKRFKDITAVDILDHNLSYDKKYENDIDAILKNPRILDYVETLEGLRAPSSIAMLIYAHVFTVFMLSFNVLDRIAEYVSFRLVMTSLAIIFASSVIIRILRSNQKKIKTKEAE